MKYSAFFKFIALLLCAVSLLGIVGSGLGILTLTEGNLYNRTVDEMVEEQVRLQGSELARTLAIRYASANLGNVPTQLVTERFPNHYYGSTISSNYSYAILDAEGNTVDSLGSGDGENVLTYSFPVSGQYMHLVSLMNEEEKFPSYESVPDSSNVIWEDDRYVYNDVPSEGAMITLLQYTYADGSHAEWSDIAGLGNIYYSQDGSILCMFRDLYELRPRQTVTDITVVGIGDTLLYEASSPKGVGYFTPSSDGSGQMFVSTLSPEPAPEETQYTETVPETTEVTVPETTVETVPETTAETTVPKPVVEYEDNIPTDSIAEVVEMEVTLENGDTLSHWDEYGIGRIRHDEDMIIFTSYDHWEAKTGSVLSIVFLNEDGETVFEGNSEESIGELFYNDDDRLTFVFTLPEPEPTVPETTVETVPTTVETVPETTVAVTLPATEPPTAPLETEISVTEPVLINGKPLQEFEINTGEYYDHEARQTMYAEFVYIPMPEYTVELYLTRDSLAYRDFYWILEYVRSYRDYLLPALGISILLFLITLIYLFFAAGHKPKSDEIRAGGLNRIPIDLYLFAVIMGIPLCMAVVMQGSEYLLRQNMVLGCSCAVTFTFLGCLLTVGFLFAAAAQFKTPGGFWWRNTLCGLFFQACARFAVWLEKVMAEKCLPRMRVLLKKLWKRTCAALVWLYRNTENAFLWLGHKMGRFLSWLGGVVHRFLILLPLTWQWLAAGFLMFLMVAIVFATNGEEVLVVLCLGACIALIVYGAHCFGTLLDSTRKMRKGDLSAKVDDKMMVGSFKEFAGELNGLAGVAVIAAQKQLKSERMKTELITNVSHDIKTPLTSIINYVDLLQKPHTPEEGEQYLEVLSRQSQQLKKLIEDLMDMSKASTGNMSVEITMVDAVESVNQALGEFADKLDKANLVPVFRHEKTAVPMMADGRLVWRVLSNLLGNAVKYAMPGTRLYVDLMELDGSVVISMKNISREELSIDADELMERFVRGDDSRNTEGSGLGLNIAKSLMELQKGQMQLLVDGDLFKVTLTFPSV